MKLILFILAFVPIVSKSQIACDSATKVIVDKFTKRRGLVINELMVEYTADQKSALAIGIKQVEGKDVDMEVHVIDRAFGCTDETGRVYFMFSDSTTVDVVNRKGFNCDGASLITLNAYYARKIKEKLMAMPVIAVRVTSRKDSYETDLSPDNSKKLMRTVQCFFKPIE